MIALVTFLSFNSALAVNQYNWKTELKVNNQTEGFANILPLLSLDEFMEMNASDFKRLTGEKLGLKDRLRLWMAKHFIRKNLKDEALIKKYSANMPQIGYIILALLGLGWLAMGILDDWSGNYWIISLVLYLLVYFPGLIYTLIMMPNYY